MDSPSSFTVSNEQFKMFHSIDRQLYGILVISMCRDPVESMQIMALWLWLERAGHSKVVKKIISLPLILISELADETLICLNCIDTDEFPWKNNDIPMMQSLIDKDISLKYFHNNRLSAVQGVAKNLQDVCVRALSDIMEQAVERNSTQISLLDIPKFPPASSPQPGFVLTELSPKGTLLSIPQETGVHPDERTMFVTFSKGYPVQQREVKNFFTRFYGDCIESLHMQEVDLNEQALFARVVFRSAEIIQVILDGQEKAKFNINGKHVWARKFVPKHQKPSVPYLKLSDFSLPF